MANFISLTFFMLFFILPVSYSRLLWRFPFPRNNNAVTGVDFPNSQVDPIIRLPNGGGGESQSQLPEKEIGFYGTPESAVVDFSNSQVESIIGESQLPEKEIGFNEATVDEIGLKGEKLPERKIGFKEEVMEIGNKEEIGEKVPGKEIGNKEEIGELMPEKEIGNNTVVDNRLEKEIGNDTVVDNRLEKEIGNNTVAEKMPEKEIGNNTVVDNNPPGKQIGNSKLPENVEAVSRIVENPVEKEIGNTEILETPAKEIRKTEIVEKTSVIEESLFNDFAELLDMMLPEVKTGDNNDLPEKVPETEIDDKSSESETGTAVESVPTVPLTRIARFRPPQDRHFRFKWRRSPRPCHHHRHHHHLFPYSRDMLIPTGENGDFDHPVIIHRHRFHRIPSRWISVPHFRRHHHHEHNDEDNNVEESTSTSVFKRSARFGEEKFKKHFHRDDHEDEDEDDKPSLFKGDVKIHKHDHKENGLFRKHFHHDDHEDEDEEQKPGLFKSNVKIHKHDHKENGLFRKHFHHEDEDEEQKPSLFKGDVKIHKHDDHNNNGLLQRIRKMLIF